MFNSIVLATDGSSHAERALKAAIDLAVRYDAQLTVVHVLTHDHPSSELKRMAEVEHLTQPRNIQGGGDTFSNVARFLGSDAGDDKEARIITALGEQIVDAAIQDARRAGVKKTEERVCVGDYANRILDVAGEVDADMIVMGRRGLSNIKGFVTGSVSHKVSQRADCSVLTIK